MRVTSLSDIAGRVARQTDGADTVTVAGVCLPAGATKFIRKQIPPKYPKWRNATDADVSLIVSLLMRESMSITATAVRKSPETWAAFWSDAENTHSKTSQMSAGTMSFVKAATLLKYALFGQSASLTTAHAIKIGAVPRLTRSRKELVIQESFIFDKEIEGKDNVEAFMDLWAARNEHQPLTNLLGIRCNVINVQFSTEQQEPLLLLPDYVAGIVHAAHSTADTLSASRVTQSAARAAHAKLKESAKYDEFSENFGLRYFDIFPNFAALAPQNALTHRSSGLPPAVADLKR